MGKGPEGESIFEGDKEDKKVFENRKEDKKVYAGRRLKEKEEVRDRRISKDKESKESCENDVSGAVTADADTNTKQYSDYAKDNTKSGTTDDKWNGEYKDRKEGVIVSTKEKGDESVCLGF